MTTIGTSHFVSYDKALEYYQYLAVFDDVRDLVDHKLDDGEIHIGKPLVKSGETLVIIDDGTRYAVQVPAL